MKKHTPGPWYKANMSNSHNQGLVISEANGANVAVTYNTADATLIAAAPDLLAALEDAREKVQDLVQIAWEHGLANKYAEIDWLRKIDAAIAKAKGE